MHIPSIHKRLARVEPRHVLVITQKLNEYIEWEDGFNQNTLGAIKQSSTHQGVEDLLENLVYLTTVTKQPHSLEL
jgi:hypothetical protein